MTEVEKNFAMTGFQQQLNAIRTSSYQHHTPQTGHVIPEVAHSSIGVMRRGTATAAPIPKHCLPVTPQTGCVIPEVTPSTSNSNVTRTTFGEDPFNQLGEALKEVSLIL